MTVKSFSPVGLYATPWTAADQAPPSMGFSRQEYWSGVPLPSSENCYTCTCIFDVFVEGRKLHVLPFHHLDPALIHFVYRRTEALPGSKN